MKKRLAQILITLCLTIVLVLPCLALALAADDSIGVPCSSGETLVGTCTPTAVNAGQTNAGGVDSALGKLKKVGAGDAGPYANADETSLATILGNIINVVLGLLGIIFVVLIVVYGYKWMMAGGDEKTVETSKTAIKNAIIGLVVTISAYAIWKLVSSFI